LSLPEASATTVAALTLVPWVIQQQILTILFVVMPPNEPRHVQLLLLLIANFLIESV
jgi:hypothetical protein